MNSRIFALLTLVAACILIATSDSIAQEVGFRGLNLGMSQYDVNKLVKETDWEYGYRRDKEPDDPSYDENGKEGHGAYMMNESIIGCKTVSDSIICHRPSHIWAKYYSGEIYEIDVNSEEFFDITGKDSARSYALAIIEAISNRYGAPTKNSSPTSILVDQAILDSLTKSYERPKLAEWLWIPQTKKVKGKKQPEAEPVYSITVSLYRSTHYKTNGGISTIHVTIMDERADRQRREDEEKAESGF